MSPKIMTLGQTFVGFVMDQSNIFKNADQRREKDYVPEVRRVTWIGLGVNIALSIFKLAAGILGRSQAVVADAVHSLSDSSTDIAILVGVRYWSQPPDEGHPHGHRRIETVVTTLIGMILAGVAVGLVYNALGTLRDRHSAPPGWIAFAAALISIVSKEGLYRWTWSVGKRIKSPAVVANAWHHRSDALSSFPAALAVAGAAISPSWSFLDHVGAVVVSLFILQAAWRIAWPALEQLADKGAPGEHRELIRSLALATGGVRVVHAIRTRHIGSGLQVDLHILVDGQMTVREGHDISETVKQNLIEQGPDVVDVVVHLEPCDEPNE
ncbi:MAG: cation diffusion facilitator family transporter [bacterium]